MSCERCEHLHGCRRQSMDLPEGCTCALCIHINRCAAIFGVKPENTQCDFEPVRFKLRDDVAFVKAHRRQYNWLKQEGE